MGGRNRLDAPMFFTLSKTVGLLALPSNVLILLAVLGTALLFSRFARAGRRLLVASLAAVVLIGITPLGSALIYPLESRFPPWDGAHGAPAGFLRPGGPGRPGGATPRGPAGPHRFGRAHPHPRRACPPIPKSAPDLQRRQRQLDRREGPGRRTRAAPA